MGNSDLNTLQQMLPLLIPIIILQFGLLIAALVDLLKPTRVTRGPKWVWALVILFVNLFGPIVYFLAGRKDE